MLFRRCQSHFSRASLPKLPVDVPLGRYCQRSRPIFSTRSEVERFDRGRIAGCPLFNYFIQIFMASCGTPGSHPPRIGFSPSLSQQTNTSGYEVRPKIEVVKPKTRGPVTEDTAVDDNQSNPPTQALSRELDGPGESQICLEKHVEVSQKRSFDQTFPCTSVSNGDEGSKRVTQTAHADSNNSTQIAAPIMTSLPASMGLPKATAANYIVDYWNGQGPALVAASDTSRPHTVQGTYVHATGSMTFHGPSSDGGSTDYWIQDEKELKRQKRKEANRESARRSRMRKQAECDELAEKVQALTAENDTLKMEVERLNELCQKLSAENISLVEQLKK